MITNAELSGDALRKIEKMTGGKLTLAKLLWAIRNCEEIPQVEFAEKLGISRQHLCDLEHGRKIVSPKLAAMYAKKLGYSEKQFVRLALQDILDRSGLKLVVDVQSVVPKASKKRHGG